MRLPERTRRWAIRLAWAGLLVAVSVFAGLRLGRPLYYTDGAEQVAATTLTAGGMLRWNTPEAVLELPGPVHGRVAELPDGRLIYGRGTDDGTTDLVVFDPARSAVPPEPVYGLNTVHNELAPAVAADGRLYFASDRPAGIGGYDLYCASPVAGGFAVPTPVRLCNTALDETDPAPHPDLAELVFVRIDRRIADGRGGDLWRVRLDDALDPEPVFGAPRSAHPVVADRDPAFAPGGSALWFVRQQSSAPLELLRTSRLGAAFDAPRRVGAAWGTDDLRAPMPSADGRRLGLLQPRRADRQADLWFHAEAEELPPWWPGQRWLEWLLLGAAAVCALLLLLLHLGRRWSALDFVAQCLLLSLLLHVLLFLWLMGVEIQGAPLPGDDADGRLQVTVVTAAAASAADGAGAPAGDVAAQATFVMAPRELVVAPPSAAPAAVPRTLEVAASSGHWQPDTVPTTLVTDVPLQDRGAEPERHSDVAAPAAPTAAELPAVERTARAAMAAAAAARAGQADRPVVVATPAVAVPGQAAPRHLLTAPTGVPLATATQPAAPAASVRDAGAAAAGSTASHPATGVDAAPVALAATTPLAPAVQRDHVPPSATATPAPPGNALPRAASPSLPAPAALAHAAPPAARAHAGATELQDQPLAASAAAATASAVPVEPTAAASAAATVEQAIAAKLAAGRTATPGATAPGPAVPTTALARVPTAALLAPAKVLPPATTAGASTAPSAVELRDRARAAAEVAAAGDAAARAERARPAPRPVAVAATALPLRAPERGVSRTMLPPEVQPPATQLVRGPAGAGVSRPAPSPPPPTTPSPAVGVGAPDLRDAAAVAPFAVAGTKGSTAGSRPEPGAAAIALPAPGGAAAAASAFVGKQPTPLAVEPPAAMLVRAGQRLVDGPPVQQRAPRHLPTGRGSAPRPAVHDRLVVAAPRTAPVPAPARVLGAAVRIEPEPAFWPAPRRAPAAGNVPAVATAVAPPGSLLDRPTLATALPPAIASAEPASAYSNRFGPAKARALETFGGSEQTERAVAAGLRYLARSQAPDGTWGDRSDFDPKYGHVYVGKTALCVLAFLGAGHTPDSRSEHSEVVQRAVRHLLSIQDPDTGAFGPSSCYGHGIATYALAECYGLTKAPALLRPLEDALAWILHHQGPRGDRRNRGGWGYFSPGLEAEDSYARVSVTAWMVMALESARLSGIELPTGVLPRAREYLELSFDQRNGWFRYNHRPSRLQSAWPTLPASTPAGAFCLLLLGAGDDDPMVRAAVDYTVERRPQEYRPYGDDEFVLRGQGNVYFWYYGSLCCFLAGGDSWQHWNERLRTLLPAAQAADGSFPPIDAYAREAGDGRTDRSYTTAMCVLSLEVYYRYFTPLLLGR